MRIVLSALAVLSIGMRLMAAEPFVGTWKLNLEKSTLQGSSADVASETMTISKTGTNTHRTTVDIVFKSGKTLHQEFNRTLDGKEHPVAGVGLKQEGDTETVELVNASTRKSTDKKDGKLRLEMTSTVSPDGKTMINVRNNVDGRKDTLVFERQ